MHTAADDAEGETRASRHSYRACRRQAGLSVAMSMSIPAGRPVMPTASAVMPRN